MWLVSASLIAHLVLAATSSRESLPRCEPTAAPPNLIVVRPGENITLRCLEGELENATELHWSFKGQNLKSQHVTGSRVFLPSVAYNTSGRYNCHAGPRLLCNITLLVEDPPEVPNIACSWRSLDKDIICQWRSSRPTAMHTEAKMWVKKGFTTGNYTEHKCRYYAKSQKFSCRIEASNYEDFPLLKVFACSVNVAGSAKQEEFLHTTLLLKPDPPVDVMVTPVERFPRQLRVTWRKPPSWGSSNFYALQFQIRYRAGNRGSYTENFVRNGITDYTITDALYNLPHTVQVRAREEFDHGVWSEWSRESIGTPWTEFQAPSFETTTPLPQFSFNDVSGNSTSRWKPKSFANTEEPPVANPEAVPLYIFLTVAMSVTLAVALTVIFIFRYKKKWTMGTSREGKPNTVLSQALVPLTLKPPNSASPLISPPGSPFSDTSVDSPTIPEHSPYDVSNANYFLLPK